MKIAIIGAGIAGITLARQLSGFADVTIFEKSRGVGGRMANRRHGRFAFDHGAQYFTARSEAFRSVLEEASVKGAVARWPQQIWRLSAGGRALDERSPEVRYVGVPGMNGLAAFLGTQLDIRLETQVASIRRLKDQWRLVDDKGGELGGFDFVVSAAPAPQAAKLLPGVFNGHAALEQVRMSGCFTLMIGGTDDPELNFDAAKVDNPVLSWIAVNSTKPGRQTGFSLVAHSRNDWAHDHIQDDFQDVKQAMLACLADLTGHNFASAEWVDLHRWRYANVEHAAESPFLLDEANRLAACGDWCVGNRVEAASESARRLGEAMQLLSF